VTIARARTSTRSVDTSIDVPPSMTRLTTRKNAPFGFSVFVSSTPASAGVSVRALKAEITIDIAIVSANC
jgi:hypothetical protein